MIQFIGVTNDHLCVILNEKNSDVGATTADFILIAVFSQL
jgi:hypothetical protein